MTISHLLGIESDPRLYTPDDTFPDNTRVGPEIEIEGYVFDKSDFKYWKPKADGSLRGNAVELVARFPIFGADIIEAFKEFSRIKKEAEKYSEWEISPRVSVHIHVDILNLEIDELKKVLLYYVLMEKVLFAISGSRENNIYCLPYYACQDTLDGVSSFIRRGDLRETNTPKYVALNTGAIHRFGSIEFRFHEGCYDADKILRWIRILLHIKNFAVKSNIDMKELPMSVSSVGLLPFLKKMFPPDLHSTVLYPDVEQHLLDGIRTAQEVIYAQEIEDAQDVFQGQEIGVKQRVFQKFLEKNQKGAKD